MTWVSIVAIVALAVAVVALVLALVILRAVRHQTWRSTAPQQPSPAEVLSSRAGPVAVVVNPIKASDPQALRQKIAESAEDLGLGEPLWFETTAEDPGAGQARQALREGARVVIAAGGDGTVREVAAALAGTKVPMGILPLGTGNLLARNLDLPLESMDALIHTALGGANYGLDLGWMRLEEGEDNNDSALSARQPTSTPQPTSPPQPSDGDHLFLVIGGIGFDANMVAATNDQLKEKMGWLAYFFAGAPHLHGRKTKLRMQVGTGAVHDLKVRSLLFANCGKLPGGIMLLPDAQLDDGWLDIAALDTRGGLLGWSSLLGQVMLQGIGLNKQLPAPSSIEFWRGRKVRIECDQPEQVQLDGDLIGTATALTVWVQPRGLLVRAR